MGKEKYSFEPSELRPLQRDLRDKERVVTEAVNATMNSVQSEPLRDSLLNPFGFFLAG